MYPRWPRREFLGSLAAVSAASFLPHATLARVFAKPDLLYPPMDLSYFDTPISPGPFEIHWGYAAITWGGNDRQAIEDISSLSFRGIQLRANAIKEFGSPAAVRELLDKHQLKFVALSSGDLRLDPAVEAEDLATHTEHAKFVRDAGGLYLQIIDQRPKGRAATPADYKRLGQLLTELGKRTADLGVSLGYHNHMGALGQAPEEVDQIMDAVDPRYAKLELDVAHYFQGGGDPAKAIEKYGDRLLFLHIKDVAHPPDSANAAPSSANTAGSADAHPHRSYHFVELGQGLVNLPAVFDALRKVNFRGWAIVELDGELDKSRTPKESGAISKKYIEEKLGMSV
jgi:inosose dehydratase